MRGGLSTSLSHRGAPPTTLSSSGTFQSLFTWWHPRWTLGPSTSVSTRPRGFVAMSFYGKDLLECGYLIIISYKRAWTQKRFVEIQCFRLGLVITQTCNGVLMKHVQAGVPGVERALGYGALWCPSARSRLSAPLTAQGTPFAALFQIGQFEVRDPLPYTMKERIPSWRPFVCWEE